MVDFTHGIIRLGNLAINKSTRKKDIATLPDWKLQSETEGHTHFEYVGNLEGTELYTLCLCFQGEKLIFIDIWPRTEHCTYHNISQYHESIDIRFFAENGSLMVNEVASWLCAKQGCSYQKYPWGIAMLIDDLDRGFRVCVRMNYAQ
ncbi:MAG: hypothetical protein IJW97_05220 [Clostridia bacterium]|nr:hypothetical protein [Clostridia bacterium]